MHSLHVDPTGSLSGGTLDLVGLIFGGVAVKHLTTQVEAGGMPHHAGVARQEPLII